MRSSSPARLSTAFCALLALLAPAAAHADCEVFGTASIGRLRVRVPDQALRTLSARDLPVAVRPGRGNLYRDVRVLGPVSFAARTDAAIPWAAARASALAGGMVWLTPRAEIEDVREAAGREGLSLRVRVDHDVRIERMYVPCDALTIGAGATEAPSPDWDRGRGPTWVPRGRRISLVAIQNDDESFAIRVDAPRGWPAPFREIERRGPWVRVAVVFSSGVELRGWLRDHELRARAEPEPEAAHRLPFARPVVAAAGPSCRRGPAARGEYVGPASVTSGTLVHVRRGGVPWAEVTDGEALTVAWRTGDTWARVVHVPGLLDDGRCPEVLHRAWVPRRAVRLQNEFAGEGVE